LLLLCIAVVVVGCSSSGEGASSTPDGEAVDDSVPDPAVAEPAEPVDTVPPADARAAADRIGEAAEVGPVVQVCLELRVAGEPAAVEQSRDLGSVDGLPSAVADLVEACGRAASLVPSWVASVSPDGSEAERRCVRDVFLALQPEEAEAVVAAGVNPSAEGAAEVRASLAAEVDGCRA